jgi:hypothetical protein
MSEVVFPEMAEFDVTCHSAGCENADITIRVSAAMDSPYVICGPCSVQIEDVIPVG